MRVITHTHYYVVHACSAEGWHLGKCVSLTCIQIVRNLRELLQALKDGTSEICCFDNTDITVQSIEFADSEELGAAMKQIIVRHTLWYH